MKVVAYLRVSTDRQAEEGLGLDVQRQAIKAWAKANGHSITAWTSDEGVSGSNGLEHRAGLAEALGALKRPSVAGLVVYRLDRLARDLNLQEYLLAEVWRSGQRVFSTSAAEDAFLDPNSTDPSRKLIRQILGAVSEYERAMIRLRMQAGKQRKKELGGYPGGRPRYGMRAEGKELHAVADEQAALERIRQLHADGASLREIAGKLTEEGHQPRRSDRWHPATLAKIIRRLDG